jgi:invasion protein IalB
MGTFHASAPASESQSAPAAPSVTRLPAETFGNWTLACVRDAQEKKNCKLVYQATDAAGKHLVMRLVIARSSSGQTLIVVMTPPYAAVAPGVRLTPGTSQPIAVPFVRCMPRACQASVVLTDVALGALASADTIAVAFVAATGKPVGYRFPTSGFKDGYAAWQKEYAVLPANPAGPAAAVPAP